MVPIYDVYLVCALLCALQNGVKVPQEIQSFITGATFSTLTNGMAQHTHLAAASLGTSTVSVSCHCVMLSSKAGSAQSVLAAAASVI